MSKLVHIETLQAQHRAGWEPLARGYKNFYKTPTTDAEFERAFQRLTAESDRHGRIHGLVALLGGEVVGLAHYYLHTSVWAEQVCYLQDLFTAPSARGQGAARALIDAVADRARSMGASRYYWLTQENNAVARVLYERVAQYRGFIRYDYPLQPL